MGRKIFFVLLFWALLILTGSAQTIQWLVKPNYDTISHLSSSVFKCKTRDKVQLVDIRGEELLSPLADSITNYSENFALVLDKSDNGFKIRGIIDDSGSFTKVEGGFLTNKYSYFSEGLVSVLDQSGKAGYLNDEGRLTISCQYRIARPFIKGWASVEPDKRQKQTIYINQQREKLKIPDFHNGKVIMGSSFNSNGEALVAYYDNDNAIVNTKGEFVRKYDRKKNIVPVRSYDFAFDENEKNDVPNLVPKISFDTEPSPFSLGQLMGYKKADCVVAPPQFSQAGQFANNCAIVCQNDKFGIVKIIEGSFSGSFEGEDDLFVAAGKSAPTYTYSLSIPESINRNALQVMFDNGDGNMKTISFQGNKYEFIPFIDHNADTCVMRMQVMSDGLSLWADSLVKSVTKVSLDIGMPEALSERANEHDELRIRSVITNNSDMPVIVMGYFDASFAKGSNNRFEKKNFWHKIAPNSKKEVFADLIVEEKEETKVFISVIVDKKNYGIKSAVIQLKPFYE